MAEPTINLPDVPALPGPAQSWSPGESTAGMPSANSGGNAATSALGMDDKGLKDLTGKLAEIDKQKIGKADAAIEKIDSEATKYKGIAEEHLRAQARTADSLKPWDADREAAMRKTDPIAAFGSFGSVFGILASAFTHAPMENALNASAAAMNAIKQGDDKAYDRAYKAWQDNEALAIKRANLQHNAYQDAISLMKTNAEMGRNKLELEFIKFGDQKNLLLHQNGMDVEVFKNIEAFNKMKTGLEESFAGRLRNNQQMAEVMSDPRYKLPPGDPKRGELIREAELRWKQSKTADEEFNRQYLLEHKDNFDSRQYGKDYAAFKAAQHGGPQSAAWLTERTKQLVDSGEESDPNKAYLRALGEQAQAKKSGLTGGQMVKEQEKTQKVESVRNQIKEAIRLIKEGEQTGNSVTGVKGALGTAKEFIVGDKSEHARFVGLLSTIQQEVKPLLTGSTRAMLTKADRDTIDRIVPGIGYLRNSKQAEDTLVQLDKILSHTDLTPGATEAVPLPKGLENEKDNTEIKRKSDGKVFLKRGKMMFPKD